MPFWQQLADFASFITSSELAKIPHNPNASKASKLQSFQRSSFRIPRFTAQPKNPAPPPGGTIACIMRLTLATSMGLIVSFVRSWRSGRALAIALALIFLGSISPASAQAPVSSLSMTETSIVHFVPPVPAGDTREGSCWTNSVAVPYRHDAWRCTAENGIHDPCFIVPPNHDRLVCDADPALKTDGFLLKLTKPLPGITHRIQRAEPWILKLADGSICEAMTGTLPAVNGQPARWSCAIHIRDQVRPVGVVTTLTSGKIWIADRYPESAAGNSGEPSSKADAEKVPIKTIWE